MNPDYESRFTSRVISRNDRSFSAQRRLWLFTCKDAFFFSLPGSGGHHRRRARFSRLIRGAPFVLVAGGRPHSPHATDRLIRCNGFDPCGWPSGLIEVVCPWHFADAFALAWLCQIIHILMLRVVMSRTVQALHRAAPTRARVCCHAASPRGSPTACAPAPRWRSSFAASCRG